MKRLSIIIPCYNEEDTIPLFFASVEKIGKTMPVELEYCFVNDGSNDQTLSVLRDLHKNYPAKVHYLDFSRNFGKEAALYAGLKEATGDYVVIMDADLQDPPELLPEMLRLVEEEDYDCVGTRRDDREGEPKIRSFFAKLFYKIINRISSTQLIEGARDYRLMTGKMVAAVLEVTEYNRFSKGILSWVGFKTTYLSYKNRARVAGESSWSFWSLFKYSLEAIVNFSEAPLAIASFIGFFSCLAAILGLFVIVIRTIFYGDPTSGWPSMVCILLLIGGLQLFCLGIVGRYIGKIFLETKNRPLYIVKEKDKE